MNILYSETITQTHFIWHWWMLIIILLGILIGIFLALFLDYVGLSDNAFSFIIAAFSIGLMIFIGYKGFKGNDTYEEHYYITIDDNISYKDVINTYEIVEQKGDIFIVKEKEEK